MNLQSLCRLQCRVGSYSPEALPWRATTRGSTFCKWPMYLVHFSASTRSSQNLEIPFTNSSLVRGFTIVLRKCFSSCHSSSIGLRSGDSGGVFHQLIPFCSIKVLASRLVCLGSLSCWNRWPSGNTSWMNGSNPLARISCT